MVAVAVRKRVVRGGRLQDEGEPLLLALLEHEISVGDLIRRMVEEQVRQVDASRRLQMMDENRGEEATKGLRGPMTAKVAPTNQTVDARVEVEKAQRAFARGDYLILIDGEPSIRLDDRLTFSPGVQIHFVRLMPLVGG